MSALWNPDDDLVLLLKVQQSQEERRFRCHLQACLPQDRAHRRQEQPQHQQSSSLYIADPDCRTLLGETPQKTPLLLLGVLLIYHEPDASASYP